MDLLDLDRRVDLDRRAVELTTRVVSGASAGQLDLPTPCAGWTLGNLLRHMVAHNHGWAAAAQGLPARRQTWEEAELGADPAAAYQESAKLVTEAFAAPGLAGRKLEVYGYGAFPAQVALGMHFVDYLVHGWDVARSLGAPDPTEVDPELAEEALRIALRWPYQRPDKAFGVKVDVPADAPVGQRLVAYLGRSPAWPQA
ncbi:MAG TPA: TIGR03086 family metal-binding protein [Micromonosporaceae bacterium]|nr:TIGR03086 family metal-binding protein [Micromonosporaceae bacterium]